MVSPRPRRSAALAGRGIARPPAGVADGDGDRVVRTRRLRWRPFCAASRWLPCSIALVTASPMANRMSGSRPGRRRWLDSQSRNRSRTTGTVSARPEPRWRNCGPSGSGAARAPRRRRGSRRAGPSVRAARRKRPRPEDRRTPRPRPSAGRIRHRASRRAARSVRRCRAGSSCPVAGPPRAVLSARVVPTGGYRRTPTGLQEDRTRWSGKTSNG